MPALCGMPDVVDIPETHHLSLGPGKHGRASQTVDAFSGGHVAADFVGQQR